MENNEGVPTKSKRERINDLQTSLNQGYPIPRTQCIQSLYREVHYVLTEKEKERLIELRTLLKQHIDKIHKFDFAIMQGDNFPQLLHGIQEKRKQVVEQYNVVEDEILLILMDACDRVDKEKTKRFG